MITRFAADVGGQVAVTFGVCLVMLVTAIGGGLDLAHAFVARQQLSHAASLTCQYSTRAPVLSVAYQGTNGVSTYVSNVNSYSTLFLTSEKFPLTQTNAAPFTYTRGGASTVNFGASMPTNFLRIVGLNTIPVGVTVTCNANETQVSETQSPNVFTESFENSPCSGSCFAWIKPDGSAGASSTSQNTFPPKASYVGATGTEWSVMGYCLEVDTAGVNVSGAPDGNHSAELDCDNGSGTAGNSSISNKNYYAAGTYELRYYYDARVQYNNYAPTYICGSTAADVSWANDTNTNNFAAVARTNQVNVYFDPDVSGAPPTHTTLDGTQTLGGANLIDECVYSYKWIERSVKITVTTAGYYWISFAADGAGDSYGGQIDDIQMCRTSCSGSVVDNFPSAWTSNTMLFEDTFESPTYTESSPGAGVNWNATLNSSYGTTNSSSGGWPSQTPNGWATAPYNQIDMILKLSDQATQSVQLVGVLGSGQSTASRTISRPFYLDPGYYEIDYDYVADILLSGLSGTYCVSAPSGPFPQYGNTTSSSGTNRLTGGSWTAAANANSVAVLMSHSQMASTPSMGGSLNQATLYTNPDGTTSTTPTVPPDAVNVATYNGAQVNPVLDYCGFSSAWTTRTTYVRIVKPGQYWLTFSAKGADPTLGGVIDDVKVKALNSLYGSAPSFYVTIPTPSAASGSTISYTGFSIIADPLTP